MSDNNLADLARLLGDDGTPTAANQEAPRAVREYVTAAALLSIAASLEHVLALSVTDLSADVAPDEGDAPGDDEPTAYPVRPDGTPVQVGDRVTVADANGRHDDLVAVGVLAHVGATNGDETVVDIELESGKNVRVYLEDVRFYGPHESDDDLALDERDDDFAPPAEVDTFAALKGKAKSKGKGN